MMIKANPFVTRQTQSSPYGYFQGTWEELEALVTKHLAEARPGYRDGVLLVPVPPDGFFSSTVSVTKDTPLTASFVARRPNEEPYIKVNASGGSKQPAVAVDIVLYRHDVLAEGNEHSCDADYEIVSINARVTVEPEPMHPLTMARNMLYLPGGTKATYTAEEFAEAVHYWSSRCMLSGS
jgi:hypothetical protein